MFQVPDHILPIRDRVRAFVDDIVLPNENALEECEPGFNPLLRELQAEAKAQGLWALGHPKNLGGGGLPFFDYVYVNEVIGRSHAAIAVLGTATLQTAIMLERHAPAHWREKALAPLVNGDIEVSFAVTEPEVASSDPTEMQTAARLEGDEWVLNGHKWFISMLAMSPYCVVMCRTEGDEAPRHQRFSMIIVPKDSPGFEIVRDISVMGLRGILSGHYEIEFHDVRVPADNLIGERGKGFVIAQERLGPGRIFHCMRWLGTAQRAFDLLCLRANDRILSGHPLGERQLVQKMVYDSYTEIQSARLLVLDAAAKVDAGSQARVEIATIKNVCAEMAHNVIDRAIQVHGAMGVSDDTPLARMYRGIRAARLVDGSTEVHVQRSARYLLAAYSDGGPGWDFGTR
jgi:acyl-CoA dehydrogenase